MEEQILEIINEHQKPFSLWIPSRVGNELTKKINILTHNHYMEFIEWFTSQFSPVSILYGNQPKRFATKDEDYTIEGLYKYWFENIKSKDK